ncbi:matrixin family metalloprotease [Marinobacter orientalis]|uniref:matrixin family metalloprotease n=1 Tax=Marinobacter orientalis TaxID=1928859 RepID=UPI00197FFB2E|nr:matrixin family metalloprotease [Marinobacter orientalis]
MPLSVPLLAAEREHGYRLLELEGYKVKWGEQKLGVGASISYAFADETLRFDDARNGTEDVYDIRYTLIHEIGRAIGLDHPGPSGQVMGFRYTEALPGLQPGDLAGIRRLYGRGADRSQLADGSSTPPFRSAF